LAIQHLIDTEKVAQTSGVFIIWTDPPYSSALIKRVNSTADPIELEGHALHAFLMGDFIPEGAPEP